MKKPNYYNVKQLFLLATILAPLAAGGCVRKRPDPTLFVQPIVAVMEFDNRAPFPMRWSLGDGMADILVMRLMETQRYQVLARPEVNAIFKELNIQASGATRSEARAALGRIKNVQYLIKGTVTDFGHVSGERALFRSGSTSFFGTRSRAVMGMTFFVMHVESGEIVASARLQESVHCTSVAVETQYKDVAFGGERFYRTPLGKVTAAVMDRALKKITDSIAIQRWRPKIAKIDPDGTIVISGGEDRKMLVGSEYEVLQTGAPVMDPDTGDPLGFRPPTVVGRIRITMVLQHYSDAKLLKGDVKSFTVGLPCRHIGPPPGTATTPPRSGSSRPPRIPRAGLRS